MKHWPACSGLSLALLMGACSSTPPEHFYTLSPAALATGKPGSQGISIAIGPATLLDLVDRPQLVTRLGENRVAILEQQRWAEPLKTEIPRVIAANLARLLATDRVTAYPQMARDETSIRVALDVQRFDSSPGKDVNIDVLWTISRVGAASAVSGRSSIQEVAGAPGYDALIAAHSRALAGVSRDVANAIRAVTSR